MEDLFAEDDHNFVTLQYLIFCKLIENFNKFIFKKPKSG